MGLAFDGVAKTISLTSGTTSLSVRDLWSRWVDWFLTGDNSKYLPAFKQVGGDDIDLTNGTSIPIYAFLMNGWKLIPQEADHTLSVNDGVLLVNGGGDPFNDTYGAYTVRINYSQPVQAITVATGGGGGLTADQVWAYSVETGLSALEAMKLFSAVLAGKTTITDLGGGAANIVFRDINDTTDRVETDMNNNERTNVSLNL